MFRNYSPRNGGTGPSFPFKRFVLPVHRVTRKTGLNQAHSFVVDPVDLRLFSKPWMAVKQSILLAPHQFRGLLKTRTINSTLPASCDLEQSYFIYTQCPAKIIVGTGIPSSTGNSSASAEKPRSFRPADWPRLRRLPCKKTDNMKDFAQTEDIMGFQRDRLAIRAFPARAPRFAG